MDGDEAGWMLPPDEQLSSLDQGKPTWYPLMGSVKHVAWTTTSSFHLRTPKVNLSSVNTRPSLSPVSKHKMLL